MTDIQNGKMIDPGKKSWNIKAGVFSSCMLHIIAMTCMLSDHMWATLFPYVDILTCIGRIAFPIFAFMIVEGFYHTSNFRRYLCRMLVFAVISEIPFDLVSGDSVLYLFHQNVLWTFLIGLLLIALIDKVRKISCSSSCNTCFINGRMWIRRKLKWRKLKQWSSQQGQATLLVQPSAI